MFFLFFSFCSFVFLFCLLRFRGGAHPVAALLATNLPGKWGTSLWAHVELKRERREKNKKDRTLEDEKDKKEIKKIKKSARLRKKEKKERKKAKRKRKKERKQFNQNNNKRQKTTSTTDNNNNNSANSANSTHSTYTSIALDIARNQSINPMKEQFVQQESLVWCRSKRLTSMLKQKEMIGRIVVHYIVEDTMEDEGEEMDKDEPQINNIGIVYRWNVDGGVEDEESKNKKSNHHMNNTPMSPKRRRSGSVGDSRR